MFLQERGCNPNLKAPGTFQSQNKFQLVPSTEWAVSLEHAYQYCLTNLLWFALYRNCTVFGDFTVQPRLKSVTQPFPETCLRPASRICAIIRITPPKKKTHPLAYGFAPCQLGLPPKIAGFPQTHRFPHHFWRGTPRINKLGWINVGSTLAGSLRNQVPSLKRPEPPHEPHDHPPDEALRGPGRPRLRPRHVGLQQKPRALPHHLAREIESGSARARRPRDLLQPIWVWVKSQIVPTVNVPIPTKIDENGWYGYEF